MTTARDVAPEWFRNWWHMDIGLGRTASESYASMLAALLSAPESVRLELAALLNPPAEREKGLARLWDAIVENTRGEAMFWIGEILLAELEKETGFRPSLPAPPSEDK